MTEATCPQCGATSVRTCSTGPAPTYCSRQCRQKASYVRRRDEINAAGRQRRAERRAAGKICPVCNERFVPELTGRQRFCSVKCGRWATNNLNGRQCSVDGCGRPHRAKGFCGTHYNAEFLSDRHARTVMVECTVCGREIEKLASMSSSRRFVCSTRCRSILRFGDRRKHKALVGPLPWSDPPPPVPRTWSGHVLRSTARVFVQGDCIWCGEPFTRSLPEWCARVGTCSKKCSKGLARRQRGFHPSPVQRRRIYERDGWVCQLCGEPVDRGTFAAGDWAPSLDHIVPQSRQLVPDHSDSNLRLAHRWCNAVRGDETYYTEHDLAG